MQRRTGQEVLESISIRTVSGRGIACAELEVDGDGDAVVLFCHGFRGERIGPNRTFVRAARGLAQAGISSLRFDQYGSGDSAGEFTESRFDDWVRLIRDLARRELEGGRRVGLLGQSMGATAAICAAADAPVDAVVAWVPDASVDPFLSNPDGWSEEGGQRVDDEFWRQAHASDAPGRLAAFAGPALLVFGTRDDYVSEENREALIAAAGTAVEIDVHEGWPHSAWSFDDAGRVIDRSTTFLTRHLLGVP